LSEILVWLKKEQGDIQGYCYLILLAFYNVEYRIFDLWIHQDQIISNLHFEAFSKNKGIGLIFLDTMAKALAMVHSPGVIGGT
jgi:hypothetical protein